jgi:hypothetical protein
VCGCGGGWEGTDDRGQESRPGHGKRRCYRRDDLFRLFSLETDLSHHVLGDRNALDGPSDASQLGGREVVWLKEDDGLGLFQQVGIGPVEELFTWGVDPGGCAVRWVVRGPRTIRDEAGRRRRRRAG